MEVDDDVLSVSVHGESIDGDLHSLSVNSSVDVKSETAETDLSSLVVLDELSSEEEEDANPNDVRKVKDEGLYWKYLDGHKSRSGSSAGAASPARDVRCQSLFGDVEPALKNRLRQCVICGTSSRGKMRRHVIKDHLPWFWSPHTACWYCKVQEAQASVVANRHTLAHGVESCVFDERNLHLWCQLMSGSLHLLRSWFNCETLDDLLQYILDEQLYMHIQCEFSAQETQFLTFFTEHYCSTQISCFTCNPPNHPLCIINWEIVSILLTQVSLSKRKGFVEYRQRMTFDGANIIGQIPDQKETLVFVDSHFHLDQILRQMKIRDFLHLQSVVSPSSSQGFYYGVANYVFPSRWGSWKKEVGGAEGVYVSFGIHPHIAAEGVINRQFRELNKLLDHHRCVAVGEIGLDFTSRCMCRPGCKDSQCRDGMMRNQEDVLCRMLDLANKKDLPVILHCRDSGNGAAAARTLMLIHKWGFAHLHYYRHCFLGTATELADWQLLPHILFGISGKFMQDKATPVDVIARILPHQLALETDSPFLSPYPYCHINHPWNLDVIATEVSKIRNVPLPVLMRLVNDNSLRFFRMPRYDGSEGAPGPTRLSY